MKISGAITALATPMKSDGTIDFSSLKNFETDDRMCVWMAGCVCGCGWQDVCGVG